ncbi:hypothetical protein DL766_001526 [Monosporascus sp. MC13-8B]|uniref:Uncharacterized protein n=1 Tax=Monosporascus cannonballus TaxID=155416 RepID=A0ABY0HLX9_9PEZI|nr:hypothetical protein DL763_007331 [Monosporascus cannonballus]RYO93763.1 hypothetical protein DL762_000968 [Monosporascus cannonballus]RYP37375.1 hypothetical protein DL766_001526 [Monosporascus sp. MC13-8B]
MMASGKFHFFSQLPVEIQLQIWKIHKEHKPKLRHTLVQDFCGRHTYEAFDVKQHVYVNTLTGQEPGERTGNAIVHPEAGEEITKVRPMNVKCWTGHYGTCALAEGAPGPPRVSRVIQKPSVDVAFTPLVPLPEQCRHCDATMLTDEHWIFRVQTPALNIGPTHAEDLHWLLPHFLSRMACLKTLYLFRYLPPCGCGPPGQRNGFSIDMLDQNGFLDAEDVVRIHALNCRRALNPYLHAGEHLVVQVKRLLGAWGEDVVIKVAFDLHDDPVWCQEG